MSKQGKEKGKKKPAIPKLDLDIRQISEAQNGGVDYSKSSPRHSIYLLVPAFTFPEPLAFETLKERCRETLGNDLHRYYCYFETLMLTQQLMAT